MPTRMFMIDYLEARKIAEGVLSTKLVPKGMGSFVLLETHTLERPLGWVFFWTTAEHSERLAGNSPFLVHREDGGVYFLGTALPVEESLSKREKAIAAGLGRKTH